MTLHQLFNMKKYNVKFINDLSCLVRKDVDIITKLSEFHRVNHEEKCGHNLSVQNSTVQENQELTDSKRFC